MEAWELDWYICVHKYQVLIASLCITSLIFMDMGLIIPAHVCLHSGLDPVDWCQCEFLAEELYSNVL